MPPPDFDLAKANETRRSHPACSNLPSANFMTSRPKVALALTKKTRESIFTTEAMVRLHRLAEIQEISQEIPSDSYPEDADSFSDAHILVTSWRSNPLEEKKIERFPNLELLIHAAGSVRQVLSEPFPNDLQISTAAHINAQPVAEFTLGAILTAIRDTFAWRQRFAERGTSLWWGGRNDYDLGYRGKRICIVGYGTIARYLLRLLRPFEFQVCVVSEYLSPAEAAKLGIESVSLDWGVANSDVISLHEAEIPPFIGMINRERIARMKPDAWLINTARGGLIDEEALIEALTQKRLWALLDVTQQEPPPEGHPFYSLPNCILTPHIAGSMNRELTRFGDFVVREITNYLDGEVLEGGIPSASLAQRA